MASFSMMCLRGQLLGFPQGCFLRDNISQQFLCEGSTRSPVFVTESPGSEKRI
uniref:Uncharacterized protein n=1 Tax=Physcomitrium patens TaxID=3218 RepID=A0A2K1KVU6_PHYPA|nr:hypothetical protein PHYPA_004911 [Physcomitrium patens]